MQTRELGTSGLAVSAISLVRMGMSHGYEENLGAADVELTAEELRNLNDALSKIEISGDRYPSGSEYAKRAGN